MQVNNNNISHNIHNVPAEAKLLISRELDICRTLRLIISRQLETIIIDKDVDQLFNIINTKSELISQLQLLADSWRDLLNDLGLNTNSDNINFLGQILTLFPDDKELQSLVNQVHEISSSIVSAENESISELQKLSDNLRSQVAKRVIGKNVAASYARMGGSII